MIRRPNWFSRLLMIVVFLFLYAPIFVLIVFSFNAANSNAVWKGFSFQWYAELFRDRIIMQSLSTTLLVSLLATMFATVAGTFAAIGFYNMKRKWRDPLMTVNNIPMMNADIVTGVSLCLFFVAVFGGWNAFVTWLEQTRRLSMLAAFLCAAAITAAGTFAAAGLYHRKRRRREPGDSEHTILGKDAKAVIGVCLCFLFVVAFVAWNGFFNWLERSRGLTAPRLYLGFGTLLIAHICFNIPYVILSIMPKLRQMDRNLIDAAQDLGCTWMQAFWKVVIPEIKPGVVSGMLIAFTMSVDDFVISYFTAGSATSTLAMTIYGMTKKRISPKINAISTLMFGTVLILLLIVNIREARQEKSAKERAAGK